MSEYLTPNSPQAFIDWPPKREIPEGYKECIKCKGHGGWNLCINAYPKEAEKEQYIRDGLKISTFANMPYLRHDMSPELFRHYYVHFRASCDNCNGWGYIDSNESCLEHDWQFNRRIVICLTEYKCTKCGRLNEVDSSD